MSPRFLLGVASPQVNACGDTFQVRLDRDQAMKSKIVKRSAIIAGHKTSVSLEDAFWEALKAIAKERDMKLSDLVTSIDSARQHNNLSSAIRLYVLNYYQSALRSAARSRSQHIMHPGQRES
jgi:predicted DNA-binding ribbon-helix-helix protein